MFCLLCIYWLAVVIMNMVFFFSLMDSLALAESWGDVRTWFIRVRETAAVGVDLRADERIKTARLFTAWFCVNMPYVCVCVCVRTRLFLAGGVYDTLPGIFWGGSAGDFSSTHTAAVCSADVKGLGVCASWCRSAAVRSLEWAGLCGHGRGLWKGGTMMPDSSAEPLLVSTERVSGCESRSRPPVRNENAGERSDYSNTL